MGKKGKKEKVRRTRQAMDPEYMTLKLMPLYLAWVAAGRPRKSPRPT